MKKCECGGKLQIICPICGKKSEFYIETEDDLKKGPKGWFKVPSPESWKVKDNYYTCSIAHMQKLEQVLADIEERKKHKGN